MYNNSRMVGRYYEQFPIDISKGLSNYSLTLLEQALEFISRPDGSSPYFLYFAPDSTHGPTYASAKFRRRSARDSSYGDAVMELDWSVGQILELLRSKAGEAARRDTLVVFTSDNGAALVSRDRAGSNGPLLCGKQTTFEGGMRTPTVAWWASGRARGISQLAATHLDLLPSLAELAGAELPASLELDGQSLASVLRGGRQPAVERPVFFYRGNTLYAVRLEQYKVENLPLPPTSSQSELVRLISGPGPLQWRS